MLKNQYTTSVLYSEIYIRLVLNTFEKVQQKMRLSQQLGPKYHSESLVSEIKALEIHEKNPAHTHEC